MTFNGATVHLGGGTITLTDSDDVANFNGSVAQTVTGIIDGGAANLGIVNINNSHASGVTFATDVGNSAGNGIAQVNIGTTDGNDTLAIFNEDVTATAIVLGDGDTTTTDTRTAKFAVSAAKALLLQLTTMVQVTHLP